MSAGAGAPERPRGLGDRIPLWAALAAPFILLVALLGIAEASIWYWSGREAVSDLTGRLCDDVSARVVDRLATFLSRPRDAVVLLEQVALRAGDGRLGPLAPQEALLLSNLQAFDELSNLAIGAEDGEYLGADRRDGGEIVRQEASASTGFELRTTSAVGRELARAPGYDPRARPWYLEAAAAEEPRWSPVYRHFVDPTLQVALSAPIRGRGGQLLGVATAGVRLELIDQFLRTLQVGRTGTIAVVDADGSLLSSPTGEAARRGLAPQAGGPRRRVGAEASESPVLRALAEEVATRYGGFAQVRARTDLTLTIDGARYHAAVAPLPSPVGLDWRVLVAIPEAEFMEPLTGSVRRTAGVGVLAVLAAALLGALAVRRVTRPMAQLHGAAEAVAAGQAPGPLPVSRRDAVGGLARSFQHMAAELSKRQRAVEESEQTYRGIFEGSRDGIFLLDARTGAVVDANRRAEQLLGRPREGLLGRTPGELGEEQAPGAGGPASHADGLPWALEAGAQLLEVQYRRPDGSTLEAEVSLSVTTIRGQERILATLRDVGARRRAEEDRRRLAAAVEQSPVSIVVTDGAADILYVNPAFERASGYCREEVLGRNARLLKSGQQPEEVYRALWATLQSGQVWRGRLVNRAKSGALFTEDCVIAPVIGPSGGARQFVAVKQDVTRELALQAQLAQSQRLESLGRLAGGIAHDFNNLLSVVLSCARALEEDLGPERPESAADAAEIREAGERARDLTRQLLAFARQQVIAPVVLDVNEVLGKVRRLLRRVLGEGVELVTHLAPSPWPVRCDPGQLEQVVMNLVVNGRDAMERGGRLTVTTENVLVGEVHEALHPGIPPGPYLRLTVADTGSGMPPEVQRQVFEPFFTTKAPGHGTGLGLATVHGIVKQSGGFIRVESALGAGTQFEILLPRAEVVAQAAGQRASTPSEV